MEKGGRVKEIFIYPIKGCRGISVPCASVTSTGFKWDRQWVIVNSKNRAYTQRMEPKLALIEVSLPTGAFMENWKPNADSFLSVKAPGKSPLKVPLLQKSGRKLNDVSMWEWSGSAFDEGEETAKWFSSYLDKPSRLVRFDTETEIRPTDAEYARGFKTMFSDEYPFLLISEASLEALNKQLNQPLSINRFRPNIFVEGCEPFAEDLWKTLKINGLTFHGVKLCSRCKVVTDNGSAYKAAGRLIMSHFPQIYWTPCAAHCIDLLLEDFAKIPWIKKVIRRAKYITKFVYAHPHLHHLFCQCSKGKEIIRPSTTRFATNYILLDSLQDAKDALMDTFVSNAWKNDDRFASLRRTPEAHNSLAIIFDCVEKPGKFWFEVLNVIEVTEPLLKVLRKVDGERPSIAFVYEAMFRAREAIRSYLRAHNLVDRFSIISTKFYERWNGQLHNDLHAAAHILNPRYGFGKSFDNNDDDVQLKIGLENVLDKLVSDPIERVQVAKDLDMYRKKMGLSFRRPVAENAKSCLNPEDWWTNYGVETKALKDVAIRIVSQPCSASGKKLFNNVW
eukprot:TRINITY_DN612_c0_g1_i6.p1 TRINITY_DN612_c0_g1~~TRINITY_DN612_c0_g1_i6.p1  ORF type:complete len:561 (-),score=86.23 TRINITY_DN612_c0_g1_i6:842-2524(-)